MAPCQCWDSSCKALRDGGRHRKVLGSALFGIRRNSGLLARAGLGNRHFQLSWRWCHHSVRCTAAGVVPVNGDGSENLLPVVNVMVKPFRPCGCKLHGFQYFSELTLVSLGSGCASASDLQSMAKECVGLPLSIHEHEYLYSWLFVCGLRVGERKNGRREKKCVNKQRSPVPSSSLHASSCHNP